MATFAEYQEAKNAIIGGVEYTEDGAFPNQWGMISKTYSTADGGCFYEVTDPNTGITEFWSTEDSTSRYYDSRKAEAQTVTLEFSREECLLISDALDVYNAYCTDKAASMTNRSGINSRLYVHYLKDAEAASDLSYSVQHAANYIVGEKEFKIEDKVY